MADTADPELATTSPADSSIVISAIQSSDMVLLQTLLDNKADVNFCSNPFYEDYVCAANVVKGETCPLVMAVFYTNYDAAKLLLDRGATTVDVFSLKTHSGSRVYTLLSLTVRNNSLKLSELLVNANVSPEPELIASLWATAPSNRVVNVYPPPILEAALRNDVEHAKLLLQAKASASQYSPGEGSCALLAALEHESDNVADQLLTVQDKIAFPSLNGEKQNIVQLCAYNRHLIALKSLVKRGYSLKNTDPTKACCLALALASPPRKGVHPEAAENHLSQLVRFFLLNGVDAHGTYNGSPGIYYAQVHQHISSARILLQHNVNLDFFDAQGASPLWYSQRKGAAPLTEMLLARGCSFSPPLSSIKPLRVTALHVACGSADAAVVHVLCKYGADMYASSSKPLEPPIWCALNQPPTVRTAIIETVLHFGFTPRKLGISTFLQVCEKTERAAEQVKPKRQVQFHFLTSLLKSQSLEEFFLPDENGDILIDLIQPKENSILFHTLQQRIPPLALIDKKKLPLVQTGSFNLGCLFPVDAMNIAVTNNDVGSVRFLVECGCDIWQKNGEEFLLTRVARKKEYHLLRELCGGLKLSSIEKQLLAQGELGISKRQRALLVSSTYLDNEDETTQTLMSLSIMLAEQHQDSQDQQKAIMNVLQNPLTLSNLGQLHLRDHLLQHDTSCFPPDVNLDYWVAGTCFSSLQTPELATAHPFVHAPQNTTVTPIEHHANILTLGKIQCLVDIVQTALLRSDVDTIAILLHHDVPADIPDEDQRTPLMLAAMSGNTQIVQWLLEYKADVLRKDSKGKTALDYARANRELSTVYLLLKHVKENKLDM